jgi:hypothetical protein
LGDELRLSKGVHEEIVHPDVEFELLLSVHIPSRGRIPSDREFLPDVRRESGDPRQQEAQIRVDLSGVLGEPDPFRPSRLSI